MQRSSVHSPHAGSAFLHRGSLAETFGEAVVVLALARPRHLNRCALTGSFDQCLLEDMIPVYLRLTQLLGPFRYPQLGKDSPKCPSTQNLS